MFGTKAARTSRNGQHPTFQTVPAATALSFLPLGFLQKCAPVATLAVLDAGFCPLSAARRTDVGLVLSFSAFDQSGPGLRWARAAAAERDCAALLREVEELRHQIAELRALAGLRDPTTPLN